MGGGVTQNHTCPCRACLQATGISDNCFEFHVSATCNQNWLKTRRTEDHKKEVMVRSGALLFRRTGFPLLPDKARAPRTRAKVGWS